MTTQSTRAIRLDRTTEAVEARHFLILTEPSGARRWLVVGQAALTIGRSEPADIVVADDVISRVHCRIEPHGDSLQVTDLGSTNGTFVDGRRIANSTPLKSGTQFHLGDRAFGYERRLRGEQEDAETLERDLESASRYVQMLLPQPVGDGPVRADWHFVPCARVGGDAFGYGPIDAGTWGGFILDVTGHGAAAALHAVSILNLIGRKALPGADPRNPAAVVAALNDMFPADSAELPLFSMWAFSYDIAARRLRYCSAGHHPAILVAPPDRQPKPLNTANPLVGMIAGRAFAADEIVLPPAATLYLFSDGVFEIETADNRQLALQDFIPMIAKGAGPSRSEPQRLYREVRALARQGPLADDLCIVTLEFP